MRNQRRIELIVGSFVLLGLLILMFLIFQMGEEFFTPQYELRAYFRNAAGLSQGVTVTLAGVPVGKVESVKLLTPEEVKELGRSGTVVMVVLSIDRKYGIPTDSELVLFRTAILGEQKLMFTESESDQFLPADGTGVVELTRLPPSPTEEVGTMVKGIRRDFGELTGNLNAVLGDEQFQENVKATTAHIARLTKEAETLAARAADAAEALSKMLTSADEMLKDEELRSIIKRLDSVVSSVDEGLSAESLRQVTRDVGGSAEELKALLRKLNESLDRQEGVLAALVTDESLSRDVKEGVRALSQSAVAFRDLIGRVSSAVDEIRRLSEYIRRNPTALIWGPGQPDHGYQRPAVGPPGGK